MTFTTTHVLVSCYVLTSAPKKCIHRSGIKLHICELILMKQKHLLWKCRCTKCVLLLLMWHTCICIFFVKPNVYYCTHWTKHWKLMKKYTLLISHDFLRSYLNGSNAMVCFQEVILNYRAILTRICTFFNHKSS